MPVNTVFTCYWKIKLWPFKVVMERITIKSSTPAGDKSSQLNTIVVLLYRTKTSLNTSVRELLDWVHFRGNTLNKLTFDEIRADHTRVEEKLYFTDDKQTNPVEPFRTARVTKTFSAEFMDQRSAAKAITQSIEARKKTVFSDLCHFLQKTWGAVQNNYIRATYKKSIFHIFQFWNVPWM